MKKLKYDTDEQRDQLINEQGQGKTVIQHTNEDGSKELHIIEGVPSLSLEERVAALEARMTALDNL